MVCELLFHGGCRLVVLDLLPLGSRFASLLLNAMIGSAIEPVDGSYDAAISACQKGPEGREQRF